MKNLIVCDITIVTELFGTIDKNDLDHMGITFHTIPSAIDKAQLKEAESLEKAGVLQYHSLDKEEDSVWIIENCSGDVSFDDMAFIRYALTNNTTILTNDPVFTNKARILGANVVDVNYLKETMESNVVANERQTDAYLVRLFRHRPAHWKWFLSQHLHLRRIAVML